MSPRKPAPVTLAGPSLERQRIAQAEAKMREEAARSYHEPEKPTPERARRAIDRDSAVCISTYEETIEVSEGDKFVEKKVKQVRFHIDDSPFERLCNGGRIDTRPGHNLVFCQAGIRYRQIWHDTGNVGLRSVDFGRVGVSTNSGLFASERAAQAFKLLTQIEHAMETQQTRVARAIILHDREPLDVGREVSGFKAPKQATGVAMTLLRFALASAARVFGMAAPIGEECEDAAGDE